MLVVRDSKIFTEAGQYLKTIHCPKKVSAAALERVDYKTLHCFACKETVIDTDYLTEAEVVAHIAANADVCLKISRFNPEYRFEK
jgi:hypothetical protein